MTNVLNNIYREFPESEDSATVIILFAPTYRAKGTQQETSFGIIESIINAITYAKENIRIYFKPHPYIFEEELNALENHLNIIIVKNYDINEWMLVADAFITDYSSSVLNLHY